VRRDPLDITDILESVGLAVEILGVAVIVIGIPVVMVRSGIDLWRRGESVAFREARLEIGRSILLGLEILVAGDIIRTVATELTFTSLGTLAALVLIRTFLSFVIELEISGSWPWQAAGRERSVDDEAAGAGRERGRDAKRVGDDRAVDRRRDAA
jgi:uncharacterized membrane protein